MDVMELEYNLLRAQIMYAVFFMSDTLRIEGLEDQTIVTGFTSEEEAYKWIADKLVEAGELTRDGTEYGFIDENESLCEDAEEAVQGWQSGAGALEFFHVYQCRDVSAVGQSATMSSAKADGP